MSPRRTGEERLNEIDTKMKQLAAQKQAIMKREQEKDRRERTRRLIQNGALAEKYLNSENATPEEFENLLKQLIEIPQIQNIIQKKSE